MSKEEKQMNALSDDELMPAADGRGGAAAITRLEKELMNTVKT